MLIFKEDTHQYFHEITNEEFISMTTFIGKFKPKEDWRSIAEKFHLKRSKKTLYEELSNKYKLSHLELDEIFSKYGLTDGILYIWEVKKNNSNKTGTAFHNKQEQELLNRIKVEGLNNPLFSSLGTKDLSKLENGIYPELKLWNEKYKVCGTSDIVKIENGFVDVDDWKTNENILVESYNHPRTGYKFMNNPINHLMDCNFIHYSLQITGYAWLLEQNGFKVRDLSFTHVDINRETLEIKNKKVYQVKYMKREFEMMLIYYDRQRG
jgi:hypothetical protein